MSEEYKVSDAELTDALTQLEMSKVDTATKRYAIKQAVQAFQTVQQEKSSRYHDVYHGFWSRFRSQYNGEADSRRERQSFYKRILIAGLCSAFALIVAIHVFVDRFNQEDVYVDAKQELILNYQTDSEIHNVKKLNNDKLSDVKSLALQTPDISGTVRDLDQLLEQARQENNRYYYFSANPVHSTVNQPLSTFSIDVDIASYAFVRRMLQQGLLPPKDTVRIEEMVNYFDYRYPKATSKQEPFKPFVAVSDSPWKQGNKLIHIGIKGYELPGKPLPRSNLVFLIDVSASMQSADKLTLLKSSIRLLLEKLNPDDSVGIVVYAGAAGAVLQPTKLSEKYKIIEALERLQAGGSTAGGEGLRLAYELAEANFDKLAVNRIILASDGDFNVGISNPIELQGFVERKRDKGIFLSVLGFGQDNYNDYMMQTLAQNGNGVAAYIDTLNEAEKVLLREASSTLFPIAKDVKIQVEFNPLTVSGYRLIGYETRQLNKEDINNDRVDAGDIGSGHTVTALYEITPAASKSTLIDELRYREDRQAGFNDHNKFAQEYAFLKIRYKLPMQKRSKLLTQAIGRQHDVLEGGRRVSKFLIQEIRFATAVAAFAQILKGGQYTGEYNYDDVIHLAQSSRGSDRYGYRSEFITLVRKAKRARPIRNS